MATPQTEAQVRAGIYCRISKDDRGDMLGVRRQEKDARGLCARKGWQVAHVYVDDDVSAWSGKRRPQYEALLGALEEGAITAVAVYDLDRLHRQPRDLERFFDVCDRSGVKDLASVAGDVDLATSDGRLLARIMGAVAAKSSDDTSRRIKRKLQDLAVEGRHHGRRPFGYTADGLMIVEAEARLLRAAADAVLGGASLNSIAEDWNRQGVPTPQGKGNGWSGKTVKQVITGPHQAGLRRHRGEVIGKGAWKGVFTRAEHERIVAALADPDARTTPRSSLLTGLVRCGNCGELMTRNGNQPNGSRGRVGTWRCAKRPGYRNCGHMSITAQPFEVLITEAVLIALEGPALQSVLSEGRNRGEDNKVARELADAEGRLLELAEAFAAGEISKPEWMLARGKLEDRVSAARALLRRRDRSSALSVCSRPGALRKAWPDLDVDRRRAVIAAVVETITVAPATRRGPVFDPERIGITWRA